MWLVQRHFTPESDRNFTLKYSLSLLFMKNAIYLLQNYYSSCYWAQNASLTLHANRCDHYFAIKFILEWAFRNFYQ